MRGKHKKTKYWRIFAENVTMNDIVFVEKGKHLHCLKNKNRNIETVTKALYWIRENNRLIFCRNSICTLFTPSTLSEIIVQLTLATFTTLEILSNRFIGAWRKF